MVQSEFQQNSKTFIVPTNNIFDEKYSRIITRTSLSNSRNSFRKYFSSQKLSTKGYSSWFKMNFNRIVKRSSFLLTTFFIKIL